MCPKRGSNLEPKQQYSLLEFGISMSYTTESLFLGFLKEVLLYFKFKIIFQISCVQQKKDIAKHRTSPIKTVLFSKETILKF